MSPVWPFRRPRSRGKESRRNSGLSDRTSTSQPLANADHSSLLVPPTRSFFDKVLATVNQSDLQSLETQWSELIANNREYTDNDRVNDLRNLAPQLANLWASHVTKKLPGESDEKEAIMAMKHIPDEAESASGRKQFHLHTHEMEERLAQKKLERLERFFPQLKEGDPYTPVPRNSHRRTAWHDGAGIRRDS